MIDGSAVPVPPPIPEITLDADVLRGNARAWRKRAGVKVRAVVKSDGYGWGASRIASAIDDEVQGYCVADEVEFAALREHTKLPIALFHQPPLDQLVDIVERGGIPNIETVDALQLLRHHGTDRDKPVRVRLGLSPAIGWSGVAEDAVEQIADIAATSALEIELWTHVTSADHERSERAAFEQFRAMFRDRNAYIIGVDVESSASLSQRQRASGDTVRIGIGLFGAYSRFLAPLKCAVTIDAPIVDRVPARKGLRIGYIGRPSPVSGELVTVRCGYGDGFPRAFAKLAPIMSVGMQYAVVHREYIPGPDDYADHRFIRLLGPDCDIDSLCTEIGMTPHECIVALGLAFRAHASSEVQVTDAAGTITLAALDADIGDADTAHSWKARSFGGEALSTEEIHADSAARARRILLARGAVTEGPPPEAAAEDQASTAGVTAAQRRLDPEYLATLPFDERIALLAQRPGPELPPRAVVSVPRWDDDDFDANDDY